MEYVLIILNLILIEGLLSVDNAAALAAMVKHLPEKQQKKALKYGIFGAYIFRGLCLFLASWLMEILWLKIVGGLYLLWLTFKFFQKKEEAEEGHKVKQLGLWGTIISVEILDLSLSIDNVFAAVALSDNIYVVMTGVFIGILAMRFVAGWFINLLNKYPALEISAFVVIGILGLKLVLSGAVDYMPSLVGVKHVLESHYFDAVFSATTMIIFFIPFFKKKKVVPIYEPMHYRV